MQTYLITSVGKNTIYKKILKGVHCFIQSLYENISNTMTSMITSQPGTVTHHTCNTLKVSSNNVITRNMRQRNQPKPQQTCLGSGEMAVTPYDMENMGTGFNCLKWIKPKGEKGIYLAYLACLSYSSYHCEQFSSSFPSLTQLAVVQCPCIMVPPSCLEIFFRKQQFSLPTAKCFLLRFSLRSATRHK